MSCETTRERLLRCERPDRPPADVQPHLAGCAACRAWQRRLTRIERTLPEVPVPPSAPPPSLLQQILNGPPPLPAGPLPGAAGSTPPWWAATPPSGPNNGAPPWWSNNADADRQRLIVRSEWDPTHGGPWPRNDRTRRKVAMAFAATIGLAVFSLCWGLWPHSSPDVAPPRAAVSLRQARLEARLDQLLSAAGTTHGKIRVLDEFAANLETDARARIRTADPEELRDLASVYVQVVRVRLPKYAESLPREEREKVLREVASGLIATNSEIDRLLVETKDIPPDVAAPLREMAQAARDGHNRLRDLLQA
jgi:hypothetical protein